VFIDTEDIGALCELAFVKSEARDASAQSAVQELPSQLTGVPRTEMAFSDHPAARSEVRDVDAQFSVQELPMQLAATPGDVVQFHEAPQCLSPDLQTLPTASIEREPVDLTLDTMGELNALVAQYPDQAPRVCEMVRATHDAVSSGDVSIEDAMQVLRSAVAAAFDTHFAEAVQR